MDDFFAALEPPRINGHGGARRGAGRKPRDANGNLKTELANVEEPSAYKRYEQARAEKEEALARQAAVKADLDEQAVVSREAVVMAAAKAFAACSQSLDSIGDTLERKGFAVDVCEAVMAIVNAAKEQLAIDLEKTHAANAD